MIARKLRTLMIQGTGSHAGKSFLTTALCRIFFRRGYSVAPFKAQNMANNAAAVEGGEIGRAQALQASAAKINADVRMNPLLLKPTGERACQAVLMGKAVGMFSITELNRRKPAWFKRVTGAFRSLQREYDLVIIEGAGSPAEINIRRTDYANMRMASAGGAAVLLAGDIDRGGVFAALYGTHRLLTPAERQRIFGFCLNKFRGDAGLLRSGLRFLKRETGMAALGVVPYDTQIRLPEEDSLGMARHGGLNKRHRRGAVSIGFVRTPHIANFTDYDPFYVEPDVILREIQTAQDLDGLDAVILPGSKNVFDDCRFLRRTGLADAISRRENLTIVGICGGYQMMGGIIDDPGGVENGQPDSIEGMGLLPIRTKFFRKKIVAAVERRHLPSRSIVRGYEIHSGRVFPINGAGRHLFEAFDGQSEGVSIESGRVWGTLTHGVFDSDRFRNAFLNRLRRAKRLPERPVTAFDVEPMIERAANLVEAHLDVNAIERHLKSS